jgi:CubicO group peptidase (beta-lactamase class C family)
MRRLLPVTIAAVLATGVFVHAADDLLLTRFGDYLNALRAQAGIPGLAAAIVGPSDVTWERVFGLQDIDKNIATRTDTPFQLDGTTETIVASLALRCASDGWLSLDDTVRKFNPDSPDAALTLRQLLTHTSPGSGGLSFSYRPDRLATLADAVARCTDSSFRYGVAGLFDRLAMIDSIPGSEVVHLTPPEEGFTQETLSRYSSVLTRLATPYAVDFRGRATTSTYTLSTLTPASGIISTLRDLEQFDLALKKGVLLRPEWIALAWTPPLDARGQRLPHGMGWFVQTYNNERIVWQFGVSDSASSSMIITIPSRGLTLFLLANSQGLVKPYPLAEGNVAVSPFARLFLSLFLR